MTNYPIIDRNLPERTYIKFYFPQETGIPKVISIPFFENVSIKEGKRAKYQKYSLIARSSNLYTYLGADSRKLNLSFNMTLPHIYSERLDLSYEKYTTIGEDDEKNKFRDPNQIKTVKNSASEYSYNSRKRAAESANQLLLANPGLNDNQKEYIRNRYLLNTTQSAPENDQQFKVIDVIVYWINIIRSSVTNDSDNPVYGPPIIRLNHGLMYQNVPCICTDYSIDFNEAAGYDLDTLLPRQIRINMRLEEIRVGDFGKFDQNDPVKKDNIAGWESLIGGYDTLDPTNILGGGDNPYELI